MLNKWRLKRRARRDAQRIDRVLVHLVAAATAKRLADATLNSDGFKKTYRNALEVARAYCALTGSIMVEFLFDEAVQAAVAAEAAKKKAQEEADAQEDEKMP